MNTNRLTNEEITTMLKNSKDRCDFLTACPYKGNTCGSFDPPSYCDKCYEEGKYNIKNGRSFDDFTPSPVEEESSKVYKQFIKITENHNKKLAKECEFKSENNTCKYKDYWEKCIYCENEYSR